MVSVSYLQGTACIDRVLSFEGYIEELLKLWLDSNTLRAIAVYNILYC